MLELCFDFKNYDENGTSDKRVAARGIARGNSAGRDGKYLMVVGNNGFFRFPGGGTEEEGSLADTMCREVKEESGYSVREGSAKPYAVVHERRKGLVADILEMDSHYFLCEVGEAGEQALDEGEKEDGLRPVWMDLEGALAADRRLLENADSVAAPRITREIMVMERLLEDGGAL